MTRPLRFALFALPLMVVALAAIVPLLLPAPRASTPAAAWATDDGLTVRGAYHVHSRASDGTGTVDEIAAAAARAGLQFVVLTDHGDGTRMPDPPRYRSGVLCIDALEVNTTGGHMVVLGAAPAPYPLAGSSRAVLEDVHRLGGAGFAAHPESPRGSLRWTDRTQAVDGFEWINADSEWRDELLESLGRLFLTYAFRPAETLASTLDRPEAALERWDAYTARGRTVGLAGADAHARLGFRQRTEPYEEGWHLPLPSYEASFKAFALRVLLDEPLSGDPVGDAGQVVSRLRSGGVYTVVDGLATPGAFEFTATSGVGSARMGDALEIAGDVTLHVRMAAPAGTRIVVLRDGTILYDTADAEMHLGVGGLPAVYRVELHTPDAPGRPPMPWLVSNPIYAGMRAAHERAAHAARRPGSRVRDALTIDAPEPEVSPGSESRIGPGDDGPALVWQYRLAAAADAFAAVRLPFGGAQGRDRLRLRASADRPMRLWVQLRASSSLEGERWGQTVYLDATERAHDLFFDAFDPLGDVSSPAPRLEDVDAVLLVVDTVNTRSGSSGRVRIAEVALAAP